jgi:hypothetical protein
MNCFHSFGCFAVTNVHTDGHFLSTVNYSITDFQALSGSQSSGRKILQKSFKNSSSFSSSSSHSSSGSSSSSNGGSSSSNINVFK